MTDEIRLPRDAPVGGQAVLEGVMMRGVSTWAVALRTPAGEIEVRSFPLVSRRPRVLRLPVLRGVAALVESLRLGGRALKLSVDAQQPEEVSAREWGTAIAGGIGLAVGLFFVVPVTLTNLFKDQLGSAFAFWLAEGVLRTLIFLAYLSLLSRMRDLRRLFEYHGAEHMVISCFEAGEPLEPERAARFSRLHPRCGTSFLLIVMIVAIFVFAPVGLPAWYLLIATRILGVPLIAGLSYEVIRWAGRNRAKGWVQTLMWPGMQLQKLTTREPDHDQLAVAVAALQAVLAVEDPHAATARDKVGMEVVA